MSGFGFIINLFMFVIHHGESHPAYRQDDSRMKHFKSQIAVVWPAPSVLSVSSVVKIYFLILPSMSNWMSPLAKQEVYLFESDKYCLIPTHNSTLKTHHFFESFFKRPGLKIKIF